MVSAVAWHAARTRTPMMTLRTCANSNKEKSLFRLAGWMPLHSLVLALAVFSCPVAAQDLGFINALHPNPQPGFPEPQHIGSVVANSGDNGPLSPAAQLYRQLRDVGLDPTASITFATHPSIARTCTSRSTTAPSASPRQQTDKSRERFSRETAKFFSCHPIA